MTKYINCDQVIHLQNALTRYAQLYHSTHAMFPRSAVHYSDTHQVGCVLEIMDILGLKADGASSEGNILAGIKCRIPQDKPDTKKPANVAVASQPETATYPNHYDKDGYCDNPARGY